MLVPTQVFCNALVPSGIAVMLACHTGGSDIVLGAQGMRAATQYLGAYLGICKSQLCAACGCSNAKLGLHRHRVLSQAPRLYPQAISELAAGTRGALK